MAAGIRYDGLYWGPFNDAGYNMGSYLRFYKGGTVLQVYSTGGPADVSRWLNIENRKTLSEGRYSIEGNWVYFTVRDNTSTRKDTFIGTIDVDALELTSKSSGRTQYKFVSLSSPPATNYIPLEYLRTNPGLCILIMLLLVSLFSYVYVAKIRV